MGAQVSRLKVAALVAGAVLVFGYLTLLVFWLSGNYAGLRGLTYYPSATWGDGLFLPIAAFALLMLLARLPRAPRTWPTVAAALVGLVAGLLVVWSWLRDPTPVTNWTIPRAHTFDAAGWYHAGFLALASALFAGLWVETLRRLRHARRSAHSGALRFEELRSSPWLAVLVAATVGYALLAMRDGVRAGASTAGLASLTALATATALTVVLFAWALGRYVGRALPAIVVGCLAGAILSLLLAEPPHTAVGLLSTVSAGLAGVALVTSGEDGAAHRRPPWIESLIVPGLLAASVVGLVDLIDTGMWLEGLAAVGVVLTPPALRWLTAGRAGVDGAYAAGWGITVALLSACLCASWLAERSADYYVTGGFVLTLVGAVLGGIFLPYFRADFERVMHVEEGAAQESRTPSEAERVVIRDTWIRTAGNSAAAFLALLALTIALAPSLAWRPGNGTPAAWTWITMLALAGVTGVGSLHALRAAARRPPAIAPPIPLLREFAPFLVFCLAAVVVVVVDVVGRGQPNWLAAVDALLVAGFMANCMVGNGARLHLAPLRGRARLCVTTASLAVAFLVYWSLTGGVSNEAGTALGFGPSLGAFAVSFALTAAMTAAGTSLVHGFGGGAFRTPYPPLAGAAQDVYLGGVLWLILGWLPQLVWAHIAEGKERLAAVGSVTGGFLLLFGPAFLWVLENNDTHNGRQRKGLNVPEYAQEEARAYVRIKSLPRRVQRYWTHSDMSHDLDEQKAAALDGHTATQNLLALTLAALTIIGGVGIASAVKDKS